MSTVEGSLRLLVEKWFAPTTMSRVRLSRFDRAWSKGKRVVRVETLSLESSIEMVEQALQKQKTPQAGCRRRRRTRLRSARVGHAKAGA